MLARAQGRLRRCCGRVTWGRYTAALHFWQHNVALPAGHPGSALIRLAAVPAAAPWAPLPPSLMNGWHSPPFECPPMNIALNVDPSSRLILDGDCGYAVNGDRVLISIDAIRNLRDSGNLSGTLALELWAFPQPLPAVEPEHLAEACRLATTTIGEVSGQHFLPDCRYDLLFTAPKPGSWHIALLLREWEGQSYRTTHTVSFAVPYVVAEPVARQAPAVAAAASQPVTAGAAPAAAQRPQSPATPKAAAPVSAPAPEAAPTPVAKAAAPVVAAPVAKAAQPVQAAAPAKAAAPTKSAKSAKPVKSK